VTPLLGDGPPTVLVHEGHLPLGVITSAGLFVAGIAFVFRARRYRRTFEQSWIVLSITAALLVLLSAAALVTYAVRTLH
jgi:drug/metabolite transporter (DMT)-like permease